MPTYYPLIPPPRSDPAATRATQQLRARRAARATPKNHKIPKIKTFPPLRLSAPSRLTPAPTTICENLCPIRGQTLFQVLRARRAARATPPLYRGEQL